MNTNGITRVENGLSLQADLQRKEVIETIKQTVARGATDAQLQMFLVLAGRYNLDPFLREIWCAQIGGQMTVLTSRDGYLKIAQRDPNFDGIVSATVCENDVFEIDPIAPQVKHAFGAKRGRIIGAYAACFHKQRRPVVCFAPLEEYRKDTPTWKTYPSAMIVKVAEALSLKRQFGISGLVTAEEIDSASEAPETTPAGKASTQMTSVVEVVPGPVVECPPTAAGSPEPISPDTPVPQPAPPIDSKRMKEEFARMEEQLGNER